MWSLIHLWKLCWSFCASLWRTVLRFSTRRSREDTIIRLRRLITNFVVHPKCGRLYHFNKCMTIIGSRQSSKKCNYVQYPNHPFAHFKRQCDQLLLKNIVLPSGNHWLYTFKVYCYKALQTTLQQFLLWPGFMDLCQQQISWELTDVYDGKISNFTWNI